MSVEPRDRVLGAVVACAGREGLSRLTVDGVAVEAGVSRASVYRWFPGGREQLVDEGVTWEIGRFLARLAAAVEAERPDLVPAAPDPTGHRAPPATSAEDFRERLVRGIMFAHRAIAEHEVLQRLLETEPGGVLPHIQQTAPLALALIREYLAGRLVDVPRRPGVGLDDAADYLARMVMSFMATPGRWDLDDEAQVRDLVTTELLAGIVTPTP